MKKFFEWNFYRKTVLIAIPIMIQNLITNFVALIDNIMVGQLGTEQMTGVSIVNQLFFVFNLTIFGAVSGAGIFCAQFFGKGDSKGVRHTLRFKIFSSIIITLVGIGVFLTFGDELISIYLHETTEMIDLQATFDFSKNYMLIMLIGLLPFSLEQAYSGTLREGGIATPSMVAGIVAVITNTVLNYFLIFGIGFFPKLGVEGAAIATVISRFVQVGIVVIWSHINSDKLEFIKGLYRSVRIPLSLACRILTKGLVPLMVNEFLWSAGVSALVQSYSTRGLDVVAGYNIANVVINLFNVMFISFGSGVAIVIGQILGAGKFKEAKETAPRLIFFSGFICVVVGTVMACLSGVFPLAYNTTESVRNLASKFILISALLMPIHGILHATYFTIRSGGKTFLTFMFDSGFSWIVSVPLAFVLANYTNIDIIPLFIICQSIDIVKCIIGFILVRQDIWMSNIVSD